MNPYMVECPICHAEPTEPCTTTLAYPMPRCHHARRELAALTESPLDTFNNYLRSRDRENW